MKGRLQGAVDAVTVLAGVALVAVFGSRFVDRAEPLEAAKLDGETIGVDFTAADQTLLLVLRSDYPYCEQSKPLYGRLSQERRSEVQFVIAAPPGDMETEGYSTINSGRGRPPPCVSAAACGLGAAEADCCP